MKLLYQISITLLFLCSLNNLTKAQNVNIPDANFKAALVNNFSINTNEDDEIQISEAENYNGTIDVSSQNISDLTGIEAFTSLSVLNCFNNQITNINISNNTTLKSLNCVLNQLTSLDVSHNTSLTELNFRNNFLTNINISNNTELTILVCNSNRLTNLDVSNNTALKELECYFNQLTNLNISNNTALTHLACDFNQLTSLDISTNIALTNFSCSNNQLTNLDVLSNVALTTLDCSVNQLTSLDVSNNNSLTFLWCTENQLTSLNVKNGNNINFEESNGFEEFNASNNPNLSCIQVDDTEWATTNWLLIDASASFNEDCSVYIKNTFSKTKSNVFPNPTKGIVNIENADLNILEIKVYDSVGKLIIEKNEINNNETINLSNYPNGMYIINLQTEDEILTTKVTKE